MRTTKIEDHIYLVDVETAGIKNSIASYILKGKQVAIIETGPSSSIPNILTSLEELHVRREDVAYVAVSHIHLDHGGGVGTLFKYLPKAKAIVHQRGAPHLANPEKLWQQSREALGSITEMYGKPEPVPEERIIAATDGMNFDIGNDIRLTAIETLGHASHHLSYYETLSEAIFPGDAAGVYLNEIDVIVPTTPSPFRLDIALDSLDKLISFKPKVMFYSHFGKALDAEEKLRTYARQLKLWAEIAKQGLENKESLESISRRILEKDPAMQKAAEHLKNHPILSETVLNDSVQGLIGSVEKFGFA
ncbi:MAG: MBL fold metallo-hydrolase [Candidatus Bathyarchaeota archaeon]|nr:MBL fold metallo-hydrolase [Candidatus Bathyarchaeota archaeon]MDH5786710.1 MBL fold metallo-hydrolase [Candidatus Bathyarchaeota archaeon]